jgi:hypothetical protein
MAQQPITGQGSLTVRFADHAEGLLGGVISSRHT